VVIDQVDVTSVAVDKPEDDSPVAADCDRPETLQFALQCMETVARQVHRLWLGRDVQEIEDTLGFCTEVSVDPARIAVMKLLQAAVTELPDHYRSV
jgi:hypothetical protein